MCVKNNTRIYVARTSRNKISTMCDLYCCLLPQCEAFCTCQSGFTIATNWCCNQDVKVVVGATFTKERAIGWFIAKRRGFCCNLSLGVAIKVQFTMNGMCVNRNTHTGTVYVARTSNNRVISSGDLCCCLLPQCEALCRSTFAIATQKIYSLVFRMLNT